MRDACMYAYIYATLIYHRRQLFHMIIKESMGIRAKYVSRFFFRDINRNLNFTLTESIARNGFMQCDNSAVLFCSSNFAYLAVIVTSLFHQNNV